MLLMPLSTFYNFLPLMNTFKINGRTKIQKTRVCFPRIRLSIWTETKIGDNIKFFIKFPRN